MGARPVDLTDRRAFHDNDAKREGVAIPGRIGGDLASRPIRIATTALTDCINASDDLVARRARIAQEVGAQADAAHNVRKIGSDAL